MEKNFISVLLTLFGFNYYGEGIINRGVEEVYHWRQVIYEDLPLEDDTLIGPYPYYIASNNDVNGIEYHVQSGLMIATVARIRPGVPSTINAFCVSDYEEGNSPHLWGFPNYERNTLKASFYDEGRKVKSRALRQKEKYSYGYYNHFFGSHNDFTIISSFFPNVDERCNRLFLLDIGSLHYSPTLTYDVQNPALIIYELPSNGCERRQFPLIKRIDIPQHVWKLSGGFLYVTLDYQPKGSCDDVFLYITNLFDNSIVVYDYKKGKFWSFADSSMKPIMSLIGVDFRGITYSIPLGIVNLALGYPDKDGNRNAYYGPASGYGEYVVSTKLLKNSKRAPNKYNPEEFTFIGYRGCRSETYKQVFDLETGVLFFAEMQSTRIRCWNTQLPLNPDTIGTIFESEALYFPADMYLDSTGYIWITGNSLAIMYNSEDPLDTTDVNSRLFRFKASEVIKGTICDPSQTFYV